MSFFFSSGNFNVIPDSVIHQYLNDAGSGSTIIDDEGSDDLSLSGTYTWISDGINFNGGFAEGTKDFSALYSQFSISAKMRINSSADNDVFFGQTRNTGARYGFVLSNDSGVWEVFVTDENGNQDNINTNSGGTETITQEGSIIRTTLTYDNGAWKFWIGDSIIYDVSAASSGLSGSLNDSTDPYYTFQGGDPNDSGRRPDLDVFDLYSANDAWGAAEINTLP